MIRQRKKRMTYTYFHRDPVFGMRTTHLFSFSKKSIPGMKRVPFPTMVVDLAGPGFVQHWSRSARYKVNRAEKEGLAVDRGAFLLPDILKLFSLTARSKKLRGFPYSYFDEISSYIACSAVIADGVMLCGHVWVIDPAEKRALLHVNATNHYDEDSDTSLTGRAHYFLLWQDGMYLGQMGIDTMDLQGYDPHTADPYMKGVNRWKAATHGRQEELYHYYPWWFYLFRKLRMALLR